MTLLLLGSQIGSDLLPHAKPWRTAHRSLGQKSCSAAHFHQTALSDITLNATFFQNRSIQDKLLFLLIREHIISSQSSAVEINYLPLYVRTSWPKQSLFLSFFLQQKACSFIFSYSILPCVTLALLLSIISLWKSSLHDECFLLSHGMKAHPKYMQWWRHFTPSGCLTFTRWYAEMGKCST